MALKLVVKLYAGGVLAGAYKSKNPQAMLIHAVALEAFQVGRLKREYNEALCNKKLNIVDSGGAEDGGLSKVDCPVCLAVLERKS